jgi:hypothetical protein
VPSHSADRSSSDLAAMDAPALRDEQGTASSALLVPAADGSGDVPMTAAGAFPATADDAEDVTRKAPRVGGRYIYGFDCAGNPILTEAGY